MPVFQTFALEGVMKIEGDSAYIKKPAGAHVIYFLNIVQIIWGAQGKLNLPLVPAWKKHCTILIKS